MKSKDRNASSSETPKDDAPQEHKRKQRIPKKGWSPPPFDAFAEADRSRPRNSDRPKRSYGDKPAFGDKPKRTFGDKPAFGDKPKRSYGDKPAFGDRPKRSYGDKPAFGDRPKRTYGDKPAFGDRPKRTFNREDAGADRPKRSFNREEAAPERPKRSFGDKPAFGDRPKRTFGDKPAFGDRPKRTFGDKPAFGDRPKRTFNRDESRSGPSDEPRRKFGRGGVPTEGADSPFPPRKRRSDNDGPSFGDRPKRPFNKDGPAFGDKPKRAGFGASKPGTRKPFDRSERSTGGDRPARKSARDNFKGYGPKGIRSRDDEPTRGGKAEPKAKVEEVRLNKYIAHSGVCARREADSLIETGKVKVNGKVVTELGTKVKTTDKVMVNDMTIQFEPYKYVLMHKPKNTITTTSDDRGRKTVMDIIENEIGERLYPVGRLDRNTTGVLLLTNDGDLANRLMHPSYNVGKVYQAEINRVLNDDELDQLRKGIELEDGPARAYNVVRGLLDPYSIELAVHEGRNHLVRRMVEALGAEIIKLKRSEFAGLDLDDLRPGRWRFLKTREVSILRTKVKLPDLRK